MWSVMQFKEGYLPSVTGRALNESIQRGPAENNDREWRKMAKIISSKISNKLQTDIQQRTL